MRHYAGAVGVGLHHCAQVHVRLKATKLQQPDLTLS